MQPFCKNDHQIRTNLNLFDMKYLFTILLCTFLYTNIQSQEIPNGGFENWTPSPTLNVNPLNWSTDNLGLTAPVYPDSSAYSGELCMSLLPDANALGIGDAMSSVTIDIAYIPAALDFYARWELFAGEAGVSITFFNGAVEVITDSWVASSAGSSSDWQLIQIPLEQIEPIITHCVITCYAVVEDLQTAHISFDDMQFGVINGISDLDPVEINIGPNPCSEYLTIDADPVVNSEAQMTVFDATGRIVSIEAFKNKMNTSALRNGLYFLVIQGDDFELRKKFIVRH